MNKFQALLFALSLSLGCGLLASPVSATDESVNGAISIEDNEELPAGDGASYDEQVVTTSETSSCVGEDGNLLPDCGVIDTVSASAEDCDNSTDEDCQTEIERYDSELENALEEGLADEPEVVCATSDEPGCAEESDPEMWTLYVSLGALALTIILVIIINVIGRKKK